MASLLLVAMPGTPSSVLAPSSDGLLSFCKRDLVENCAVKQIAPVVVRRARMFRIAFCGFVWQDFGASLAVARLNGAMKDAKTGRRET